MRFLFPVLPLWNICAAVAVQRITINRTKSLPRRLLFLCTAALLAAGAAATALTAAASAWNYPGGYALARLHALAGQQRGGAGDGGSGSGSARSVHIGVLPAMTGVSRFGEMGPPWHYSKVRVMVRRSPAKPHLLGPAPAAACRGQLSACTRLRSQCAGPVPGSGVL